MIITLCGLNDYFLLIRFIFYFCGTIFIMSDAENIEEL